MTLESEREVGPLRVPTAGVGRPVGHATVTQDRKAIQQAGEYFGAVLLSTSGGAATAAFYDGHDATGDLIDYLATSGASTAARSFASRGVRLLYGLYVDLGSNVSKCSVFFDPAAAERQ